MTLTPVWIQGRKSPHPFRRGRLLPGQSARGPPDAKGEPLAPFESRVQFDLTDLESADAVAWCNAPVPTRDSVNALKEFAMRGGAVSFFLGNATNPDDFAALIESGLFPGNIRAVDPPVLRAIQTWDQSHEALRRFDGGERGNLRGLLLRDAFSIEAGPDWKVLAALDNGHPVLLTRELGKGRVLVFANPLTRAWSDFPTQRIFLPLMKEWFTWLTRFNPEQGAAREVAPGLKESRPIGTYGAPPPANAPAPAARERYTPGLQQRCVAFKTSKPIFRTAIPRRR